MRKLTWWTMAAVGVLATGVLFAQQAELTNPVQGNAQAIEQGLQLFRLSCASCHGEDGRPDPGLDPARVPPPRFDAVYVERAGEALRARVWHILSEQKPSMPHFRGRLGESEARAIVTYLRRGQ